MEQNENSTKHFPEGFQGDMTDAVNAEEPQEAREQVQEEEVKDMEKDAPMANIDQDLSNYGKNEEKSSKNNDENISVSAEEEYKMHHIKANVNQVAMLNKMLPKGFKFDIHEVIKR